MIPSDLDAHALGAATGHVGDPATADLPTGRSILRSPDPFCGTKVGGFASSSSPALRPGLVSARWVDCLRPFVHPWRCGKVRCACGAAARDPGAAERDAATEGPRV